ncbi:MAG: site-specific DNA-methyltransferase [Ferrimicrobium sp.]
MLNQQVDTEEDLLVENQRLRDRLSRFERNGGFGLVWENIPEAVEQQLVDDVPVLKHVPSLDVPGEKASPSPHVLIEGDNLHALHVLQATHRGKVDVIYIDPPYNLGGDFRYNDKIVDKDSEYRHSAWLSFMDKRMRVAQPLLKDTGVIIAAIDDTEFAHLKLLMDQTFGAHNFIANIVWTGGRKNDSRFVSVGHDYMLIYAKSLPILIESDVKWRERKHGVDEILAAGLKAWEESGHDEVKATVLMKAWWKSVPQDSPLRASKHYNNVDGINGRPGSVYFAADISWPGGGGPAYEVLHPITNKPVPVPSRGWVYQEPRMLEEIAAGRVRFGPDHTQGLTRKSYLDKIDKQVVESSFYSDRRTANKALAKMIGYKRFDFPKDATVIARWLNLVTSQNRDAIVLDFFAGSGTTLHAVAELNKQDGGNRRCILVTNNENDICREVALPRIKAVLTGEWASGKHDPLPGSLEFYTTDFFRRSKSLDQMRADIAEHTVDLIAIKDGAVKKSASAGLHMLYGGQTTIAVVTAFDLNTDALTYANNAVRDGDSKIAYLFTWSDHGIESELVDMWTGWDVHPLPAEMLAALRRLAPKKESL